MFGGPELYELATHLTHERRKMANGLRMASQTRRTSGAQRTSSRGNRQVEGTGRWTLEWVHSGFTGVRVIVRDETTGQERSGRHPFDWDLALGEALQDSGLRA
jgi:hypothetical protein